MSATQPLAVVALARRFGLYPRAAAVLVDLYRTRHPRHLAALSRKIGASEGTIRVYLTHIRNAMSTHAVTCDYQGGYVLGERARTEIRQALGEMAAEVSAFIQPLLADAA